MSSGTNRLVTVVLTVADLDESVALFTNGFGLDLHIDDHQGDEPWISGRHAATSWTDGAFIHFALYETKDGSTSRGAQIAFRVDDLDSARPAAPWMPVPSFSTRQPRSRGDGRPATPTRTDTSSN